MTWLASLGSLILEKLVAWVIQYATKNAIARYDEIKKDDAIAKRKAELEAAYRNAPTPEEKEKAFDAYQDFLNANK